MDPTLQNALEKAWKGTCKVLFGQELGDLARYETWLGGYLLPTARRKSYISGREVMLAMDDYPENARFASQEEVPQNRKYSLGINQVKDIDSIVEGIRGQCEYAGNRVLGNSSHVEASDIVFGSHYVCNSTNIEECEYVYSSFMMRRRCKYSFGSAWSGDDEFVVRVFGSFGAKRCFESQIIGYSSDMYLCHNCDGCHDMIFSFGQRNGAYKIGNLSLPKEKYFALKRKIIGELAEEIIRNGGYPSLYDLVPNAKPQRKPELKLKQAKPVENPAVVERGFASTYNVVLKRKPKHELDSFAPWLLKHSVMVKEVKTLFGSMTCYPENLSLFSRVPLARLVRDEELLELGKTVAIDEKEADSLKGLVKALERIGYLSTEIHSGENFNYVKSPIVYYAANVYGCYDVTYADNAGYCSFALNSKYTYGCRRALESQFSLKCYNSLYLSRCFELDSCNKCADSYFCHNSEGLQDCMFCFNLKGKRHNIGNTAFEKEKYAQVKDAVLGQIADDLDRKKTLTWDIFSIGAGQ